MSPFADGGFAAPRFLSGFTLSTPFSLESATHSRSPEVSSTAFRTQPPNLQPVSLMDMGFTVSGQLARHRMPQIRFLYIGSYVCSTILSNMLGTQKPAPTLVG